MTQIAFLDTNIMLDYLENRNSKVRNLVVELLLLHEKERIKVATSVFNIAELIDKEFEISFSMWCLSQKMSFDEIRRKKTDSNYFRDICKQNEKMIEEQIDNLIFKKQVEILHLPRDEKYGEILGLIYKFNLQSQDALIVATAISNDITYFLSNDSDLNKKISEFVDTYNLHVDEQLDHFRNNVLEAM